MRPETGLEPVTPCLQERERGVSPRIAGPGFGLAVRNHSEAVRTMRGD